MKIINFMDDAAVDIAVPSSLNSINVFIDRTVLDALFGKKSDGTVIILTSGVTYPHLIAREVAGTVDYTGAVPSSVPWTGWSTGTPTLVLGYEHEITQDVSAGLFSVDFNPTIFANSPPAPPLSAPESEGFGGPLNLSAGPGDSIPSTSVYSQSGYPVGSNYSIQQLDQQAGVVQLNPVNPILNGEAKTYYMYIPLGDIEIT